MRLVGWFFPPGQNLPPTLPPQMDNKLSGLNSTFKSHRLLSDLSWLEDEFLSKL